MIGNFGSSSNKSRVFSIMAFVFPSIPPYRSLFTHTKGANCQGAECTKSKYRSLCAFPIPYALSTIYVNSKDQHEKHDIQLFVHPKHASQYTLLKQTNQKYIGYGTVQIYSIVALVCTSGNAHIFEWQCMCVFEGKCTCV